MISGKILRERCKIDGWSMEQRFCFMRAFGMAKILFVEDDRMIASGIVYALEQQGYHVTHCTGVEEA